MAPLAERELSPQVTTGDAAAEKWAGLGAANDILDGFAAGLRDDALMPEDTVVLPLCMVNGNTEQRPPGRKR